MNTQDDRGAGGKAPRGPRVTAGNIVERMTSPLQRFFIVRGKAGASPNDSSNRKENKDLRPELDQQAKVQGGSSGFSFPALGDSNESPPTNTLARPSPVAEVVAQPRAPDALPSPLQYGAINAVTTSAQPRVGDSQAALGRQPTAAPLSSGPAVQSTVDRLTEWWSPSKQASLQYFLSGGTYFAPAAPPELPPATGTAVPGPSSASEQKGVYLNLAELLKAGPGGYVRKANGNPGVTGATSSSAGAGVAMRYNPYGRPNAPRPPRPCATGLGPSVSQPVSSVIVEAAQHRPMPEHKQSLAVAAARLPPPNPRFAPPPSGIAPRAPTVPGAVRLAPGQMALPSGGTGTPLPKFGPMAVAGLQPSASFKPVAGAVGGKRQRESPMVSPLATSAIRTLSEFKKRRQTVLEQPRSVLVGLSARTPRQCERASGAVASGGSGTAAGTPGPTPGEVPQTETARKMIGFLDSCERTGDAIAKTTNAKAAKIGTQLTMRTTPPTESPLPVSFMPPLERLDQNHYGGTPTPGITAGEAGFPVCGATPSPLSNPPDGVQTPGPRMVLEFNTPTVIPVVEPSRRLDDVPEDLVSHVESVTDTLPLSPIAVQQVAATANRDLCLGPPVPPSLAVETSVVGKAEMCDRTDVFILAPSSLARSDELAQEPTGLELVPKFSFRSPHGLSDHQLLRVKEICETHSAVAASSSGSENFTFEPATTSVDTTAPIGMARASGAREGNLAADEVKRASEVPLPDDDEDDVGVDAAAAIPAPVTTLQAPSEQPQAQIPLSFPHCGTNRVAFADKLEVMPARRQSDADAPSKAAVRAMATPPVTPGGVFFSSHAGSTPFRPLVADSTPGIVGGEKTALVVDKDASDAGLLSPIPFGTATSTSAAAEVDVAKPSGTLPFGLGPVSDSFVFGALSKPAAVPSASAQAEKVGKDKTAIDAQKATSSSELAKFGSAPLETGWLQSASLGNVTLGVAVADAPKPNPMFVPSAASAAATISTVFAPGTALAATMPSSNAANQLFGSTPSLSTAPVQTTTSSEPMVSFGVASARGSAHAVATGFTPGSSADAPASSSAEATSFVFGAIQPSAGSKPQSFSFGSPMPVANPAFGPSMGAAQPLAGSVGCGTGSFGASSNPATSFPFGGSINAGASNVNSSNFGPQHDNVKPVSTYAFTTATSVSTFGAVTAAPTVGAMSTPHPAADGPAPTFGASASANPFGAAAPSFSASTAYPTFGAPTQPPNIPKPFGAAVPASAAQPASTGPAFVGPAASAAAQPSFAGFGNSNGGAPLGGLFTFGGAAAPSTVSPQPAPSSAFGQAAPSFGMQAQPAQAASLVVGGFSPATGAAGGFGAPAFGDAGGGFALGHGDPKDGRKKVKARRHG
ncbi:hypothetical protein Vretifemale_11582 [Volvox reticuliferus]|uniref:Uncharacterized protein n=1 Tax=Volvox reticuliferus TaxID=1737510 RepID=A0A8J4FQ36_9CHLO|nr:hypothetical protein Vretifemale_11582 [Volvox reticuliferus]